MASFEPEYNKINSRCGTNYGYYFTDHFTAELGWEWRAEKEFQLFVCSELLRNFTVSDDEVSGELCTKGVGIGYNTYYLCYTSDQNSTYPVPRTHVFDVTQNPDNGHHIRMAFYIREVTNGNLTGYAVDYEFYDVNTREYRSGEINGTSMTRYVIWTNSNFVIDMYHSASSYDEYRSIDIMDIFSPPHCGCDSGKISALDSTGKFKVIEISTNIPVFDSLEHAKAYLADPTITEGLLNANPEPEPTPEEEYNEQFAFHYVNNIFGHNTRNATAYTGYRNYRFFPKKKRMCFYRVTPTANNPYTVRLMGYDSSVVVKSAPAYASSDEDYETISGAPELYYLHKSISFANNDYYTKFKFSTDLLVYGNESDAQDYIDGTGDPRLAENFNDVSRQYNEFVDPGYGNPDTGNDHGKNGINYSRGSTLWMLTETEMHTFYGDIFNTANISDILSNTQLFGANQINSILGVAYYPFDVADVCRLDSTKKIYVGSWECPNATGKRVLFNYDLIDCGSIAIPRVYNDYRDYEMEIYISLPYVGVHKLNTALYMGASALHIYYAVDVSTGCCTAHLHVTNETLTDCEIDSWDGFISSMRPISAVDQQAYISGVMGNVTSIFNRETGMINDAAQAIGGVMTGNAKGALSSGVGPGYGLSQSAGAIGDLYGLSQSVRDVPISTRGGFSGALGMFGNQKIHIITAQKRKTVPDNKLLTVGLPSNIGGRVGLFSGFLSVSAFTMADGFTGTAEELHEIESIMANGIFL